MASSSCGELLLNNELHPFRNIPCANTVVCKYNFVHNRPHETNTVHNWPHPCAKRARTMREPWAVGAGPSMVQQNSCFDGVRTDLLAARRCCDARLNAKSSTWYGVRLRLRMNAWAERLRQYAQQRGHSNATCPPCVIQRSAVNAKFLHNMLKVTQRRRILVLVVGPRCQMKLTYGLLPAQGRAPNRRVGVLESETGARVLSSPACVVKSLVIVKRVTSQI